MERITDKLRKLLALAEGGKGGEAVNAKKLLELHLKKYGLTLEDICENTPREREIKYKDEEELRLIIQIIISVIGSRNDSYKKATYNSRKKTIQIDLTDFQFAEISSMVDFFVKQFRKDKKQFYSDFFVAFVQKHKLFDITPDDVEKDSFTEMDFQRLSRIIQMADSMENITYRKQISNK